MTEEFLHYIWKFRLFNNTNLKTHTGEAIEIVKPGDQNHHAGPDFQNAVIKIGETLWAGNVEIHINSSDWNKHKHSSDKVYNNVILHVVLNDDCTISRTSGEVIPAIELKERIDKNTYLKYADLISSKQWISCSRSINQVDSMIITSWLSRLLAERLERKSESIINSLNLNKYNWQETFYQQLARNFGFKLNAGPFEMMAKSLPLAYLGKHRNNLEQIEALIFGQAGMLDGKFTEDYPLYLQKEYSFLKLKYKLQPIDNHLWKFLRLRPASFPTIRLSQFSQLINNSEGLLSKVLECSSLSDYYELFKVSASYYWQTHYTFGKQTAQSIKLLGKSSVDVILINTVAPFLFVYGSHKEHIYKEKGLNLLESIQGENNSVIKKWKGIGMETGTAFNTQALLELKSSYCDAKKCLSCSIGSSLLKSG